jgi:dUTP pyrophosphatase
MLLKFAKIHPDAKAPERANPADAGADLFYCGEDVTIYPETSALLSTGLKVEMVEGFAYLVHNRGSMASKKLLTVGAEVCDAGYEGEVFVNLINNGKGAQVIKKGDKIAQLLVVPVITASFEETLEELLYKDIQVNSSRGEGGFGSTGQ